MGKTRCWQDKKIMGAFFASQKTGLFGGSVRPLRGRTASRPYNPLRAKGLKLFRETPCTGNYLPVSGK
jgi:hypothetical protein